MTTGPGRGVARTLAIESATTALIVSDTPTFQTLVAVDLTTGATTDRGLLNNSVYGLDFSAGLLYGVGSDGQLYSVNAVSGAASLIGDTGNQFYVGLAIAPGVVVPAPAAFLLFGLGAFALGIARRQRRA